MSTPIRYTKRPVTIEAMQLTGATLDQMVVYQWIEANTAGSFEPMAVIEGKRPYPESGVSIDPRDGRLIISTLEGLHWADPGDWIIRGVAGEFCPCKPAIFDQTYRRADDFPRFPTSIEITDDNLLIDGEPFPWWIADNGIDYTLGRIAEGNWSLLELQLVFADDETTLTDTRTTPTQPAPKVGA